MQLKIIVLVALLMSPVFSSCSSVCFAQTSIAQEIGWLSSSALTNAQKHVEFPIVFLTNTNQFRWKVGRTKIICNDDELLIYIKNNSENKKFDIKLDCESDVTVGQFNDGLDFLISNGVKRVLLFGKLECVVWELPQLNEMPLIPETKQK